MDYLKINKLQSATLMKDNKLKLIYDCSNKDKIAEIEYIVDLNKPAQCEVSTNTYDEWGYPYREIAKKFPMYNPYVNVAFMFETEKAYEARIKDRVKKMTVEEIEKKLGYKVEIVSN